MERDDNIELRSEKVRNIIGQIPPRVIRWGITVIFFVLLGLLIGSYFLKYDYIIKTTAIVYRKNDTTYITLRIPANEIVRIRTGQKVFLNFDNIRNLYNKQVITSLPAIPHKLQIKDNEGFYTAQIKNPQTMITRDGEEIDVLDSIIVKAEVITGKVSFFDRIVNKFE
jgi:hypothetical protein